MNDHTRFEAGASVPDPRAGVTIPAPRPQRARRRPNPEQLREWFGLTEKQFAKSLGVPEAVVRRWRWSRAGPAPRTAGGEMLAMLAELRDLAVELFGPEEAKRWLTDPAPPFGGRTAKLVLVERGPRPLKEILLAAREGAYI